MPQAKKELRQRFMTEDDQDGIGTCEKIIQDAGGEIVDNGYIGYEGDDQKVMDAIEFLCCEWDYSHVDQMQLANIRGDLSLMEEI